MIPRADWAAIKSHLRRSRSLQVRTTDRRSIRTALKLLNEYYPTAVPYIHMLPISTMQWSSVVLGLNNTRIVFVDVEQANALSFLMAREFWLEMPIFSYAEFMIRAAEVYYDDGDLPLAVALSERVNLRLREYCLSHKSGLTIPRPITMDLALSKLMEANTLFNFIIGHEVGHVLQRVGNIGIVPLFDWVAARYEESHLDKKGEKQRERFLGPEIVQKFDANGRADGYAIQTIKLFNLMPDMQEQQIREVQSDALGVIVSSDAAVNAGIPVDVLFRALLTTLENAEMLKILRRVLPRLPRGGKRASIPLEHATLIARQCVFIRLARGLKDGSVPAPAHILRYWSTMAGDPLDHFEDRIDNGQLEQLSLRSEIMVRGGIELALQGHLGKAPNAADLIEKLGIMAGNLIVAHAHLSFPDEMYMIERCFDWSPDDGADGILCGFSSAIRDICDVAASEMRPRQSMRKNDIIRDGTDAKFIEFLRSARTQIFLRQLNPKWATGYEGLLSGTS